MVNLEEGDMKNHCHHIPCHNYTEGVMSIVQAGPRRELIKHNLDFTSSFPCLVFIVVQQLHLVACHSNKESTEAHIKIL